MKDSESQSQPSVFRRRRGEKARNAAVLKRALWFPELFWDGGIIFFSTGFFSENNCYNHITTGRVDIKSL